MSILYLRCNINYQFDITEKKFSYESSAHIPCYILKRRSLRDHYLSSKRGGEFEDFVGGGGFDWFLNLSVTDDNFKI